MKAIFQDRAARPRATALRALAALAILGTLLLPLSCGKRVFSATLSGYVDEQGADPGSAGAGVNGAEVRVYLERPETGTEENYLVKTSTMTSGNQGGYWSHKVMWENWFPKFPDEGDSGTLYVSVRRPGYFPRVVAVSGILSDSTNVVPTIELERIKMASLRGRVVNGSGQGVNGVSLTLDLQSTQAVRDYVATTATDQGEPGYFEFTDIAWIDPDSLIAAEARGLPSASARSIADGAATETARLYVDDAAWFGQQYGEASPLALSLASGEDRDISATTPIVALSAAFSREIVEGRVTDSGGSGINGVAVALDLASNGTGVDYGATTMRLTEKTGQEDGWYRFSKIAWTDSVPEHPDGNPSGDSEAVAVYVNDDAYASAVTAAAPLSASVPSDPAGTAPAAFSLGSAMVAQRAAFRVALIEGRVTDGSGNGLNGITVNLDLGSTQAATDASAATREIGGQAGRFQFTDVSWRDKTPESPERESALLSVAEGDWDALSMSLQLAPDTSVTGGTAVAFTATRRTAWSYRATLSGRVLLRYGSGAGIQISGLSGVWVSLSAGANGALLSSSVPSAGISAQTAADGSYSFTIDWTRSSAFAPTGPGGGDVFNAHLAFTDLQGATADPGPVDIQAQSWAQTTGVPDLFYDAP
jgi:hypothetical protein